MRLLLLVSMFLLWAIGGADAQNVEISDRGAIFLCPTKRDALTIVADAQTDRQSHQYMSSPEDFIENWVVTLSQPNRKQLLRQGMPACTPIGRVRVRDTMPRISEEQLLFLPHSDFVLKVGLYRIVAPADEWGPADTYWIVTMHPLRRA